MNSISLKQSVNSIVENKIRKYDKAFSYIQDTWMS